MSRQQLAAPRAVALLSNPHSRNLRAAPRFSPTGSFDEDQDRFIPLVAPAGIILELDYSHALGIKRYTLDKWISRLACTVYGNAVL